MAARTSPWSPEWIRESVWDVRTDFSVCGSSASFFEPLDQLPGDPGNGRVRHDRGIVHLIGLADLRNRN
jgi:hypothetical protein